MINKKHLVWNMSVGIIVLIIVAFSGMLNLFSEDRCPVNDLSFSEFMVFSIREDIVGSFSNYIKYESFLSKMSSLQDFILSGEDIENLESDFFNLASQNDFFYQLRYIDENGFEKVRVDSVDGIVEVVPKNLLQKKSSRPYFSETMKLDEGQIYVSSLDLNMEDEVLENRGSVENPIYVPVIRYATPVFDKNSKPKGIVISNIYAEDFLFNLRNLPEDRELFLINKKGFYLANENRSKEFGFAFNNKETFFNDFGLPEDFFENNINNLEIEHNDLTFVVRYIFPAYVGSEVFSSDKSKEDYWILIDVVR